MLNNDARKTNQEAVANWSDSILWFVLAVIVGLCITGYLFAWFVKLDHDRVERRLQRGLGTMAFFSSQPAMDAFFLPLFSTLDGIQREAFA
jgi:hypothetical protein